MTTPTECFKKQATSNACKVFDGFIKVAIVFAPLVILLSYLIYGLFSSHPTTLDETANIVIMFIIEAIVSVVVNGIYIYVIAIPFVDCYYGEKL